MANKKKKKANRPKAVAAPASSDQVALDSEEEFEESEEQEVAPEPKKEAKSSAKGKEKEKPVVVKSQARAKDPKKAAKKPNIFRRFIEYLKQVRLEIKRTTWPTKNEVLNMAIIVLVALLFFGVLIFIIDQIMIVLLKQYGQLVPTLAPDVSSPDFFVDGANSGADVADVVDPGTEETAVTSIFSRLNFSNLWSAGAQFFGGE